MSLVLYNLSIFSYSLFLRIAAWFHQKAKLFIQGRKSIFLKIEEELKNETRPVIWLHCASLGEFEQGRSLIELLKKEQKNHALFLTFFSPSGYEIRKDYPFADYVFYLPIDSNKNAKRFLEIVKPQMALFVKYELWFHYLNHLDQSGIPTILFSAHFQKDQVFFQWYGGLYRKMLGLFDVLFVQDESSKFLLGSIGITKVEIAGDTRFDRSAEVLKTNHPYPKIEQFKTGKQLIIAGSVWEQDIDLLMTALPDLKRQFKLLIVPHEVEDKKMNSLLHKYSEEICLWNSKEEVLRNKDVALVKEVGHLAYLYRYADVVWIGGGLGKNGIHNLIEPAVYGIPLFFGPNYHRFREAKELIECNGAQSISSKTEFVSALEDQGQLLEKGENARNYVLQQLGATQKIYDYLDTNYFNTRK